jgi:hypothetical protein
VKAAGNNEPIPFNGIGDTGRIGLDHVQVAEGLPALRLTAGRVIELAHMRAAELVLQRIWPARKSRPIAWTLPAI